MIQLKHLGSSYRAERKQKKLTIDQVQRWMTNRGFRISKRRISQFENGYTDSITLRVLNHLMIAISVRAEVVFNGEDDDR